MNNATKRRFNAELMTIVFDPINPSAFVANSTVQQFHSLGLIGRGVVVVRIGVVVVRADVVEVAI